jgi:hypothetical protein
MYVIFKSKEVHEKFYNVKKRRNLVNFCVQVIPLNLPSLSDRLRLLLFGNVFVVLTTSFIAFHLFLLFSIQIENLMNDRPQHEGVRDVDVDTSEDEESIEEKAANLKFKSRMKASIVEREVKRLYYCVLLFSV